MELTKEEQNKITSFQEQYAVIRDNIKVATDELESVLFLIARGEEDLSKLRQKIVDTEHYIEEQQKAIRDLAGREKTITEKEQSIAYAQSAISNEIIQLDTHKKNTYASLESVEQQIAKTQSAIETAHTILVDLDSKIAQKRSELCGIEEKIITRTDDLNHITQQINSAIESFKHSKEQHLSDLSSIKEKIENETADIRYTREQLNRDIKEYESKKKNFDVLFRRFQKAWKKLYPNQQIII